MTPCFATNNFTNLALPYAVLFAERCLCFAAGMATAYLYNLLVSQFGLVMMFAYWVGAIVSSLCISVSVILRSRSDPKVIRIHAKGIISIGAIMQHALTFGDFAKVNLPGNTMRLHGVSLNYQPAVAVRGRKSLPKPTLIERAWRYILPESLGNRLFFGTEIATGRGIIGVHKNLHFLCLIRERFAVAARYFRVHYSFNYSTLC